MAIKNYTTTVPANRSIEEIQRALVANGATGVLYEYEKATGRIAALKFILILDDKQVGFALPVEWRRFQQVLKNDHELEHQGRRSRTKPRYMDEDYVYRVAWRCLRDWVLAQMALYATQIVDMPQIFLPFAVGKGGKTFYEQVMDGKFLLKGGDDEE